VEGREAAVKERMAVEGMNRARDADRISGTIARGLSVSRGRSVRRTMDTWVTCRAWGHVASGTALFELHAASRCARYKR